jgi:hypothetical protein
MSENGRTTAEDESAARQLFERWRQDRTALAEAVRGGWLDSLATEVAREILGVEELRPDEADLVLGLPELRDEVRATIDAARNHGIAVALVRLRADWSEGLPGMRADLEKARQHR